MKTDVQQDHGCTIVRVAGSVDALTAPELARTLAEQVGSDPVNLIVDLGEVEFMSSAGLRTLLGAVKDSRGRGGDLRIVSTNPGVDKVLKMSGFSTIAKVFPSHDEAVASFGS